MHWLGDIFEIVQRDWVKSKQWAPLDKMMPRNMVKTERDLHWNKMYKYYQVPLNRYMNLEQDMNERRRRNEGWMEILEVVYWTYDPMSSIFWFGNKFRYRFYTFYYGRNLPKLLPFMERKEVLE